MTTEDFERELIARAQQGDADAGIELLRAAVSALDAGRLDSPLIPYLQDSLMHVCEGVPADRALGVEQSNRGGRPEIYSKVEIMAADILLRDHAGKPPETAVDWLFERAGVDRRKIQESRKLYDARYNPNADKPLVEALDQDLLLHLAGSLREAVASELPQSP